MINNSSTSSPLRVIFRKIPESLWTLVYYPNGCWFLYAHIDKVYTKTIRYHSNDFYQAFEEAQCKIVQKELDLCV